MAFGSGNTSEVKIVVNGVDNTSGVFSSISKSSDSLKRTLGNLAKASAIAVGAVSTAIIGLGKVAVSAASDFEQNRIAFETMLGGAQQAQKMLNEITNFAKKTPFELPEVVTGAKQLLAYNIEAEKIIPTFKALGNIAAGVGRDKLPNLVLAFGQVRAAGRLTGMELRQFSEAGVPLLDSLSKQFGVTAAKAKEMVETGAIGFPEVEKAIFGMSEEGGKFFNLMEKQSASFSGIMSNIKDTIKVALIDIIGLSTETGEIREGSIFSALKGAAEGLRVWLEENRDTIVGFFDRLYQSVADLVSQWDTTLKPAWDDMSESLDILAQGFDDLGIDIGGATEQAGKANSSLSPLQTTLLIMIEVVNNTAKAWNYLVDKLSDFFFWMMRVQDKINNFGDKVQGVMNKLSGVGGAVAGFNTLRNILGFQHGGVVPGRPGEAVPIIAHGGEVITNPNLGQQPSSTSNYNMNISLNSESAVYSFFQMLEAKERAQKFGVSSA